MAIPTELLAAIGAWHGISRLNYSEDPSVETIHECESDLTLEADPLHAFATVRYTWSFEGQSHQGSLTIAGSEAGNTISGAWVDSWHQNGSVLPLTGSGMQECPVRLTGKYGDGAGNDWGWRIEIAVLGDRFDLKMINITPDGDETWAVSAEYARA